MAEKLAEQGWLVRVDTVDAAGQPAVMYFAVGKNSSGEAITAVLNHPGLEPGDQITRTDQLTPTEILSFRLRPEEVRTHDKRPRGPRPGR
jgi:hypothetical protein